MSLLGTCSPRVQVPRLYACILLPSRAIVCMLVPVPISPKHPFRSSCLVCLLVEIIFVCSLVCLLACLFVGTEYTDSQIVCLVGPGVGTGFQFYITGWIAPPQTVGYAPPSIKSLSPSLLPVTGGIITLTGSGFGVSPCGSPPLQSAVLLRLTSPRTASQLANATAAMQADSGMTADASGIGLTVTSVKCDVISWSNTTVGCVVPAGLDPIVPVTVTIGNQAVSLSHAALGFVPPTVFDAETPVEPSTAGCILSS